MELSKLAGHVPDDILLELTPEFLKQFDIDGPRRLSHLLGQCKHESGGFKIFSENLNYSAQGLVNTFKKYFPTLQSALDYARKPVEIANKVYANRMGNGDEESGEGYKFRGRGPLQTTGKDNYEALGDFLNVDLITQPELVATTYRMSSAAFFFKSNGLWAACDKGVDYATIKVVTQKVNGGQNGFDERLKYTTEFYEVLTSGK